MRDAFALTAILGQVHQMTANDFKCNNTKDIPYMLY